MSIVLPVLDSSMDERGGGFCNSPFIDEQQSWNTTDPDFSPCFQKTVILWIPCAFLVLVTPFHIYFLTKSQAPTIPSSCLSILKTVLAVLLAVAAIADIGKSVQQFISEEPVPTVDFISPLIFCLTMVLATFLIQHERKHGVQSSGVMFLFWLMLLTSGILIFQSKVRTAAGEGIDEVFRFVIFFIEFPVILIQFILTWFVDRRKNEFVPTAVVHDKPCPEADSSFISRISFWWFSGTVVQGYKHALKRSDLFAMNEEDMCSSVIPHFDKYWHQEIEKEKSSKRNPETPSTDGIELQTRQRDGETYTEVNVVDGKPPYKAKLLISLIKAFWPMFLLSALYKLIFDILQFVSPLVLKQLIMFTRNKSEYQWRGYVYAVMMFVVAVVQSFILHQYFHGCQLLGMKLRTAIITVVYRKMLLLSNTARRNSTVGEIVNLMSVDAQRFMELMTYFHTIWSGPFQIVVSLYFLWQTLGPSVLAGTGVMIVMIPVNAVIAKKSRDLQMQQMKFKDSRIKLMNEVLNGIKVSLVTFAVYVLVDSNNILDAEKAFVSLSLFNILRFPLSMLPQVISSIVQVSVSVKRLQHFLDNEQLDIFSIDRDTSAKHSITIEKGTFTWEKETETPTLREINLEVPDGSLVAVVGSVGSGKSSILSAILGEMEKLKGKANVKGSIAYVAQQAWIQNATLQDNILFGKTKYQTEYSNVLDACALKTDLEILPAGDETEIGEKGINLSGGQKQRVSLARAVYQDADIYLLDDPLSAVDSHVGKHIFDQVIGPRGLLKEKTRVLVTHGIGFLPKVDLIVVLVNGQISEVGSFQELIGHAGAFAEFLKNYLTEELDSEDVDLDLEEIEELKNLKMAEEIVSQLGSIMEDDKTAKLQKQVSVISSRLRTMSGGSQDLDGDVPRAVTPVSWKGSQPKFPTSPVLMRQKSEHPVSKEEKEAENLKRQVQEKKKEDKLIQAESVETGTVKMTVFLSYLKSVGPILSCIIILFYILYNIASVYSNIWLSEWSNDEAATVNGTVDTAQRDLRLGVYGALGLVQGTVIVFASLCLYLGNVMAGRHLHAGMLKNIMASPMEFFDTTPLGRMVNRFSKDIDVLDVTIPRTFEAWLACLLRVLSVPVVIGYSTPLFLTVLIPLGLLYFVIQDSLSVVEQVRISGTGIMVVSGSLGLYVGSVICGRTFHARILGNIMASPMQFFDTTPLGRIMNRFSKDIDTMDTLIPRICESWLHCLLRVVAVPVIIAYSTPLFLSVLRPLGILYFVVQRFYVATSRQLKRLDSVSRSPIYSHFGETVTGVTTIRAYKQQERFISESEGKVDENNICYFPSIIANRWLAIRLEFVANCIVFFAALFAVLGRDELSAGLVGLSITYALNVTQTLNWLVRMTCELETNIVAVERVKEYSETPTEAAWEIEDKKPDPKWPETGKVTFENYGTRYREGLDLVLKGITCEVQPGEKVGIVGRTGAGKSSLTLALFRIIEKAQGSIIIDGIDIASLGLHDLRSKITIIPQEPVLFSGTLKMNLDPFEQYSDAELWRALEHAHLKSFVKELPTELMYECSEGGENLSVGQRQLVCLARALLRKTKILVLDEATAAVDLETDDLIQNTIRTEFHDCTILTIAHRLNTIMDYDKIMVLDAGVIREYEIPHILLQDKETIFYGMAKDAGLVF
ncbi:multidrug resistance-associated protein 1-like [Mizuhopecten yessoensis]|uniref:multidrug resistance-associated protein 1-like n=2 Tax=Mizuhopecten yessoensis TaxID=6573 RepID=UPI000B45F218|nr:multidrug resistance-associated protein 1-like [Mizuhopecten yessoensis]